MIQDHSEEADESVTRVDSSVPLMYHDLCDLGSLIWIQIIPVEHTLSLYENVGVREILEMIKNKEQIKLI